jgi:hypothetical protein
MTEGTELVRYDAMCRAIEAAYAVDEVKDIRDKARAIEVYARQAKSTEAERQACEIRLRAERKVGQLLREREMARGAAEAGTNRGTTRSDHPTASLSDLGITKQQSSDWQKLAALSRDEFESALAAEHPTTSGIIAAHTEPKAAQQMDDRALWVWGRLQDFERQRVLDADPRELFGQMFEHMRETTRRLAPVVAAWLGRINER